MGCDIHVIIQKRDQAGRWINLQIPNFWTLRNYALFGWLVGIRNYSGVDPLSEPRGLPDDFEISEEDDLGDHSFSWFSIEELMNLDYDQIVEDRRCTREITVQLPGCRVFRAMHGGQTCAPGEGEKMTLRKFLGHRPIIDLMRAHKAGAERIVFGFDN